MSRLDDIRERLDVFVMDWSRQTTKGFNPLVGAMLNDLDAILGEKPCLSLDLKCPPGFAQADQERMLRSVKDTLARYGVYPLEARVACPTCDKTMSAIACKVTDKTAFLCPVCGTFRPCEGGEPVVPDLVRRCRLFEKMFPAGSSPAALAYRTEWRALGINEAINIPKDRPQ